MHIASEHRGIEDIKALLYLGHKHFAEKYCQEMVRKWAHPELVAAEAHLTFFGHVQTNKARKILGLSNSIEGIDSLRVAKKFADLQLETGFLRRFLLQINISREPQKSGCPPEDASRLLHQIRTEAGLNIDGVMIIPQQCADPSASFRWARTFADTHQLQHCAMGMSGDYAVAINCGATMVRIGRLVWGD